MGREADSLWFGRGCQAIVIHFPTTRECRYEDVVTFRLRRKLTRPMSHSLKRYPSFLPSSTRLKHTTRADVETTQALGHSRSVDVVYPTPSTPFSRTEQVCVEQQTLVQRVAAVEREGGGGSGGVPASILASEIERVEQSRAGLKGRARARRWTDRCNRTCYSFRGAR
jgi:hypothetical protein